MDIMKVTGLFIFAVFGMASAELIGDGDSHHHTDDPVGPITPGPLPFPNTGQFPITLRLFILTAAKLDGHVYIFRTGVLIVQGSPIEYGEYGERKIVSGFLTTETGQRVSVDGGLLYCQILHPRNKEAIRRALFRTDMTIEHFSQQTGVSSPKKVYDVISGVISINGIYRNVNSAVTFILTEDLTKPVTKSQGLSLSLGTGDQIAVTRTFTFVVAKLDGIPCIFLNGSLLLQGTPIGIGEDGPLPIISGFLTTETGYRASVEGGLLYARGLHPKNTEAIRSALSRADMTLEYFIEQSGFGSHTRIVSDVTSGVISISGTYWNINAAVLLPSVLNVTESVIKGQTVVITETATPDTLTLSQPVTLTKTSTIDEYTTITSPVYNSAVSTYTNFLRRTVTITEEQVIRSPVAGRVVVNTIPVTTQLVLTVTDTATNYFVSTALETVTSTQQHFSSIFSFKTIMVNNIITSTVVHTITRTSIATTDVTNTVGSTVYSTTAVTVIISHGPATTETFPVYY